MSKTCIHEVEFQKFESGIDNKSKKAISHFTISLKYCQINKGARPW